MFWILQNYPFCFLIWSYVIIAVVTVWIIYHLRLQNIFSACTWNSLTQVNKIKTSKKKEVTISKFAVDIIFLTKSNIHPFYFIFGHMSSLQLLQSGLFFISDYRIKNTWHKRNIDLGIFIHSGKLIILYHTNHLKVYWIWFLTKLSILFF